jgi:hypothetical protein
VPLKNALRTLQLLTPIGAEIPATSIDAVLNHSDRGTQAPWRGGAVEIVVTVCTQRRCLLGAFRMNSRNLTAAFV